MRCAGVSGASWRSGRLDRDRNGDSRNGLAKYGRNALERRREKRHGLPSLPRRDIRIICVHVNRVSRYNCVVSGYGELGSERQDWRLTFNPGRGREVDFPDRNGTILVGSIGLPLSESRRPEKSCETPQPGQGAIQTSWRCGRCRRRSRGDPLDLDWSPGRATLG